MGIRYLVFLFLDKNICYGYSLEAPHRGTSNEYPQHMFSSRNKKNIDTFWLKKAPYQELWLSVPHTLDRFFFLHNFDFWKWIFDNAVTSIADVCHIVWRLLMSLHSVMSPLKMAYQDIVYNQCISNTWRFSIFIFPTRQIRVCEIRFASIGVICRNPYPVCKKIVSDI